MLIKSINKSRSSLLHMDLSFLLWGFVVLNQDIFGGRTRVQHCTTERCSLSVPGDGRAVLSQGNVYPDYVHYRQNELHGSQVVSLQVLKWKGSSVLASLSVVLKALLGIGYKRRWDTSQQWNVHHAYFCPTMASFSQIISGVKLVQSSWGSDALWPECVRICASEIWSKWLKGVSLTSLWGLSLHTQEGISKD